MGWAKSYGTIESVEEGMAFGQFDQFWIVCC